MADYGRILRADSRTSRVMRLERHPATHPATEVARHARAMAHAFRRLAAECRRYAAETGEHGPGWRATGAEAAAVRWDATARWAENGYRK